MQKYANQITYSSRVDLIVILDRKLMRYSQPNTSRIGKRFSSPQDAKKSSTGKSYYSYRKGILGTGYRIFVPVFKNKQQVDIICVSLTDSSINRAILSVQKAVIVWLAKCYLSRKLNLRKNHLVETRLFDKIFQLNAEDLNETIPVNWFGHSP